MKSMNREIEWNYAYFKKVRLCFTAPQKKLKDVKFMFKSSKEDVGKGKSGVSKSGQKKK